MRPENPELHRLLAAVKPPSPPPAPMREVVRVTLEIPAEDFAALEKHSQHEKPPISVEGLLERLLRAAAKAARENKPDVGKR